ncbi:hypothetical protein [Roseiconus lacunae]|uniref:IgGFc-binding protein N-terminal domain-containing protein n=1 Tax=Roseiconus lacunae TaxID=2605694 RepID=A0ABT7PHG5_9BACT|nr:hypothetical protein [Roseiconus lacunae]MDM4015947.1 hypothetical protein [Roseiconus lacunae]
MAFKKYTPGACNGGCPCEIGCQVKTFFGTDDWDANESATMTGPATGDRETEIDLDGIVNPASYVEAEAYQIDFALHAGKVVIRIESIEYVADATTQTITANGTTIAAGRSAGMQWFPHVEIRVTPTHVFIFATGNYKYATFTHSGENYDRYAHAILVVERDGSDPPTAFTAIWDEATVSDFTIRSSEVIYTGDYGSETLVRDCWLKMRSVYASLTYPLWRMKPYLALKSLSQNHVYTPNDLFVPQLSFVNEYSLAGSASGVWIGDTTSLPGGAGYDGIKATNGIVEMNGGGVFSGDYCAIIGSTAYNATRPHESPRKSHTAGGGIVLDLGTHSAANPYPLPVYKVSLTMTNYIGKWNCGGSPIGESTTHASGEWSLDVNDLVAGFVYTVSAASVVNGCTPPFSSYDTGFASIQWTL